MDIKSLTLKYAKKYWYVIILLVIFLSAFWVRSFPARFNELQAIDPFYIYRMSEYVHENGQLPEMDYMRHHPFGVDPTTNNPVPFFLPAYMYVFLGPLSGLSYFNFALLYPAIMGAVAVIIMFFIGRELFDNKTGLFAAFFLATVPAFLTRTAAGFFDKEASAGVFMLLAVYFFVRSYKRGSWRSGIISGVSMFLLAETWGGGTEYIYLLITSFTFVMLILNRDVKKLTVSYVPFALVSVIAPQLTFFHTSIFSFYNMIPLFMSAILLIRVGAERFNVVKKDQVAYIAPAIIVIAFMGAFIAPMVTDFGADYMNELLIKLTQGRSVEFSTVAEANPGNWNSITGATTVAYSQNVIPQLSLANAVLSINVFMFIGALFLLYRFYRRKDFTIIFILIWLISSIWSVFGYIRLLFFIGPPIALVSAYFISKLIDMSRRTSIMKKAETLKDNINYVSVPLAVFIVLVLIANFANAYVYGMSMGPSFNNYWKEAMEYLATETPEDSNILSWWDFGYWFQTRGQRPSFTDGGSGRRYDVAIWFTADPKNWTDFEPWLMDKYGIDYILMDYTLPAKYGAISKIASNGKQIVGMLQFEQSQVFPQEGNTIIELKSGPYALWLPMNDEGTAMVGAPMLLGSQGGQYYSKVYINDLCTVNGIVSIGNEENSIGGCVAMTNFGVFYVPPEAEHTIFTSLMFMEGHGFPVEKTFDNQLIKIFRVIYDDQDSVSVDLDIGTNQDFGELF
jgi:dolichyl-diphosphooligosaccharide--protein glycosyltransferase